MGRKLFCEICPLTYKISEKKGIYIRKLRWLVKNNTYARDYSNMPLEISVYSHKSLIKRRLGDVDMTLQENKAVNLSIASPKINGILIKPNQTFSFWKLVGKCTKGRGYREGLIIKSGGVDKAIGGGMCQFTNLIHWMILHSQLTITEHHHHNQLDMFPDYGRQIPFGTGTSIMYNYLDYQFTNNTEDTYQLFTYIDGEYLCGELRCDKEIEYAYHIIEEDSHYTKEENCYYRNNKIYQRIIDKRTGNQISQIKINENHSKVLYDHTFIPEDKIR